ncbi:Cell cycle-regulated histone H1-binding protein [Pseudoloma neurophilia]|uniref:Cell cycle-regulated histone H1-binding protein n=1 Tax=Pseudoloma neurophilia TaxID=146866 RepID=A0A0R0M3F4_9MICR|nr:Cell cycle-regulated histone H1-binding protein [Pseudoloma neurophilia]
MTKLQIARSLTRQKDFEQAANVYSEILIQLEGGKPTENETTDKKLENEAVNKKSAENNFDNAVKRVKTESENQKLQNQQKTVIKIENCPIKPVILIEYSHALIKHCFIYYDSIVATVSNNSNKYLASLINKKSEIETDLEIAWESLEQARIYFNTLHSSDLNEDMTMLQKFENLSKISFLEGEIYLLNEQWNDAVISYTETLEMIQKYESERIRLDKIMNIPQNMKSEQKNDSDHKNTSDHKNDPQKSDKSSAKRPTPKFKYVTPAFIHQRLSDLYVFLNDSKNADAHLLLAKQWYNLNLKDENRLKKMEKIERLRLLIDLTPEEVEKTENLVDVNHLKRKKGGI